MNYSDRGINEFHLFEIAIGRSCCTVIYFAYRVASAYACFLLIATLPNVIQFTDFFYSENTPAFSSLKAVVFKFIISFSSSFDLLRCQDNWAIFFKTGN